MGVVGTRNDIHCLHFLNPRPTFQVAESAYEAGATGNGPIKIADFISISVSATSFITPAPFSSAT